MQTAHTAVRPGGQVIWITGLSGAGKTTLAQALMPHLPRASILLDGDELREVLGSATSGFDRTSRKALAFTYARLARLLARQGLVIVVATISLFHSLHTWNREHLPHYFEIFLDTPEDVRRTRDPKGIYAANAEGHDNTLVGGGIAAEIPLAPDLRICCDATTSVPEMLAQTLEALAKANK